MYDTFQRTLIAWAFNHYIAYYYFDNVNVTQLKVAFERGEIELENLPFKRDALRHLKLPWDVVSGTVGKLVIKIPLFSLLTDPWIIKMSSLTLILAPRSQQSGIEPKSKPTSLTEYSRKDSTANEKGLQTFASAEESKLVEFYSLFSATVSSVVKDIYKNIKLEIESMTLLFEGFKHGVVKFSSDHLLLHRPEAKRKINLDNVSIYFSGIGPHTWMRQDDLLKINLTSCNLELCDVATGRNQTSLDINSETDFTGTVHIVSPTRPAMPLVKLMIEDFRMLFFSADQQQDGTIFARVSCRHFNRDAYTWDNLLEPWPFNLSWNKRKNERRYSLTSDELAKFTLSCALLDLIDAIDKVLKRQDPTANDRLLYRSTNQPNNKSSPRACKLSHYNILLAGSLSRWPSSRIREKVRRDKLEINFVGPGLRFILVDNKCDQIARISFKNIVIKSTTKAKEQVIDCSIQDILIENALPECSKPIVLDRVPRVDQSTSNSGPALRLIMDRIIGKSFGTLWFRQFQISMCELVMNVEERLFLKLVEFISFRSGRKDTKGARDLSRSFNINLYQDRVSKYYFDMLRIDLEGLRMSFFKSPDLPEALQKLRAQLSSTFYNLDDARVHLTPYMRMNVSQTWRGILDSISRFYRSQVSEQAPWILMQQLYNQLRNRLPNLIPFLYDELNNNLFY